MGARCPFLTDVGALREAPLQAGDLSLAGLLKGINRQMIRLCRECRC